jgi:hypothetical protein
MLGTMVTIFVLGVLLGFMMALLEYWKPVIIMVTEYSTVTPLP